MQTRHQCSSCRMLCVLERKVKVLFSQYLKGKVTCFPVLERNNPQFPTAQTSQRTQDLLLLLHFSGTSPQFQSKCRLDSFHYWCFHLLRNNIRYCTDRNAIQLNRLYGLVSLSVDTNNVRRFYLKSSTRILIFITLHKKIFLKLYLGQC